MYESEPSRRERIYCLDNCRILTQKRVLRQINIASGTPLSDDADVPVFIVQIYAVVCRWKEWAGNGEHFFPFAVSVEL